MRLLIAWASGGNWGHVSRQLALARHAEAWSADVVWAVPARKVTALQAVRERGYRILACRNVEPPLSAPQATPRCYADILLGMGFGNEAVLEAQVTAWLNVFARVKPDRVLIDYAPAAQLAALLAGLPTVQVTNGFDSPPAECPPYEGQVRGPYLRQHAAAQVQKVERAMQAVAHKLAPQRHTSLPALIDYPQRLFDCVPESDPYAEQRDMRTQRIAYVGPLGEAPAASPPNWPAGHRSAPRVFAYLRGTRPHVRTALEALSLLGADVLCVWPDVSDDMLATLRYLPRLHMTRQPVHIQTALAQAQAVLNYGSSTVVAQTILSGKPQLMLPTDHEKLMVSAQVARNGLGGVCTERESGAEVQRLAQKLLMDAQTAQAARTVAARHVHLPDQAATAIREALGGAAHHSAERRLAEH